MVGGIVYGSMCVGRDYLWSLQTCAAKKHPVTFVRATRRFLDSLNRRLYCRTRYGRRWLELIGFKYVETVDGLAELEYGA